MAKRFLLAAAITQATLSAPAAPEPSAFLSTYCLECHDEDVQKGDRRFDELSFPITDAHGAIEVQDIIDQLTLGDMPPKKSDQPSAGERTAMIDALTALVANARESLASTGAQTVLRRLNEREYLNSVQDLLGRDFGSLDPTAKFPRDQTVEQMDNIGDALVTSGYLLDQYLDAADLMVEKALGSIEAPAVRHWTFNKNFQQGQELSYSHGKVYNYRYLCVYEVPNTVNHEGGYAAIHDFADGVHAEGWYDVKVLAQALNRHHPYDPAIFGMNPEEPFRLGIVPGDKTAGTLHHPQPVEPELAEVTIADGEPEWYTLRVWLEKGQTPRFIFPNGMKNCRQAFSRIASQYKNQWPKKDPYTGGIVEARRIVLQHGHMPHIRIHEVQIEGPFNESWPPASQRLVFGPAGFDASQTREILHRFADRAYRRPATEAEVDHLVQVADQRRAAGHSPRQAVKDAIKAALCSPSFLYLSEPSQSASKKAEAKLGPHDLAARLSYFLWSTTPDEPLRAAADDGSLLRPEVLQAQLERLLKDPRSEAFYAGFLDSWLNLRTLGDMPPDREAFGVYYAKDLQNAMKRESQLFLRHMMEKNRPVTDLLQSDYTFVNEPLATLYKLPVKFDPASAHQFQKVSLTDPRRGGLLGMGSVLTVTANGIETSPVLRGVWLLRNVLGTPPPPPPDNVPPIDPDVRGTKTIRDQLTKHRESPACFGCHQKIDPLGFALENFDPIGQWRSRYPAGKKQGPEVDASGELAHGGSFEDIVEFKQRLLERKTLFERTLTERLLMYAVGRRLEALDRPVINTIVRQTEAQGSGLRTLLRGIVTSEVFLSR
ncbi:MAG: DUF1592 domain-containing protein [Verrucomicrobiales bacterium]|nr:DUF1592 domain-containing protein [Verrucomicrobiales bacterium]